MIKVFITCILRVTNLCLLVFITKVDVITGLDFVRVEGFVFSHIADEGLMNACAGDLLRYRKQIGADDVLVFTDIKKKHRFVLITKKCWLSLKPLV